MSGRSEPVASTEGRLRIDAIIDLFMGLGLVVAALIRHAHTYDGMGAAEFLLWTFAALAGVRAFARFTAVLAAEENRRPDPRP